jgi:triosephosphate isomerase (TIM)
MRSKFVVGNWKLNASLAGNETLLKGLLGELGRDPLPVACAVCAPAPYLWQVRGLLEGSSIAWGAQDVSRFDQGAYTGEVSGPMLVEMGCRYVIVGHSERRTLFGETDEVAAEKYVAARRSGLTPVFCVGETLEERDRGATESVLARQVDALVGKFGVTGLDAGIVAYEPVWAIGTGRTASAQQADDAHAFIRERIGSHEAQVGERLPILYGGSVKPANAGELFAMPNVDGGLIGGASLVAKDFAAIWRAAAGA